MTGVQIAWFKSDLRVHDHAKMSAAAERLTELREHLAAPGQPLVVRVGEAIPVLT